MKAIVAVNNLGVIGNNGTIPWRCRADQLQFKELTMDCGVIMGHNTLTSLGSYTLPGRDKFVVGTGHDQLWTAVEKAFEFHLGEHLWVIGGASIYKQLLPLCSELHISYINNDTPGDCYFEIPKDYRGKVIPYYFEPDSN